MSLINSTQNSDLDTNTRRDSYPNARFIRQCDFIYLMGEIQQQAQQIGSKVQVFTTKSNLTCSTNLSVNLTFQPYKPTANHHCLSQFYRERSTRARNANGTSLLALKKKRKQLRVLNQRGSENRFGEQQRDKERV